MTDFYGEPGPSTLRAEFVVRAARDVAVGTALSFRVEADVGAGYAQIATDTLNTVAPESIVSEVSGSRTRERDR